MMDAQEYAMSGQETRDQQEAEAQADIAAMKAMECLVCWTFPNACSRPVHECDEHRVDIEELRSQARENAV